MGQEVAVIRQIPMIQLEVAANGKNVELTTAPAQLTKVVVLKIATVVLKIAIVAPAIVAQELVKKAAGLVPN
jgi:hypothetical protein